MDNCYLFQLVYVALLALPVACVSWTITNEEIFRDLREWLGKVSHHSSSMFVKKLCYLPTCHYCFSHWVTAGFLVLTGFHFLQADWRGYILAEFAIVLIVNVYLTVYNLLRVMLRWSRATADQAEARTGVYLPGNLPTGKSDQGSDKALLEEAGVHLAGNLPTDAASLRRR